MPEVQEDQITESNWKLYSLDHYAQELVIKNRDKENVLNESHKMRMSVAYGLERFWGEHLRLMRDSEDKGNYWKSVWDKLEHILQPTGINLPNDNVKSTLPSRTTKDKKLKEEDESRKIEEMAARIWSMPIAQQRIVLMVLTQFCDALVWWTQRYKKPSGQQPNRQQEN
jgi:hypothetical protein